MFVADVNMSDVVSYLRRFRASIATGTAEGSETAVKLGYLLGGSFVSFVVRYQCMQYTVAVL